MIRQLGQMVIPDSLFGETESVDGCQLVCCRRAPLAVVDIETTGLDPKFNEILEIAIVLCDADGSKIGKKFSSLVKPSSGVDATWVHGITDNDVKDAPSFCDIAGDVADLLSGCVVVAHNAYFDVRFLNAELTRAARLSGDLGDEDRFPMFPTLCTMWSSRVLGARGMISLSDACDLIGYEIKNAHRALDDALAASALVQEILLAARWNGDHVNKFGDPSTPFFDSTSFVGLTRSI